MHQNPDFIARRVNNELVLVPVSRCAADFDGIFTLNEVGARIWDLIGEGCTVEAIARQLSIEYDVAPATAAADADELIAQLAQISAVLVDGAAPADVAEGA
jgi:hypothetical protein